MLKNMSEFGDGLPEGWDLDRVRAVGGLRDEPALLPVATYVVEEGIDDLVELSPKAILDCGGLYLVLDFAGWHMGHMDADDGSIVCWACYGDLATALRGL